MVSHLDLSRSYSAIEPPDLHGGVDRAMRTMWRWRWLFLGVSAAIAILGVSLILLLPVRYTANATVMVGIHETNVLRTGNAERTSMPRQADIDSAIQLITGLPSLREVARTILPEQPPDTAKTAPSRILEDPGATKGKNFGIVDIIAEDLQKNIRAEQVQDSNLIKITYSGPDPVLAAKIVNALASRPLLDSKMLERLTLAERTGFDLVQTLLVSPAAVPLNPSSPNIKLIGGLAIIFGLGAGCSAVSLADYYTRRSTISISQMDRAGVRNLALIPDLGRRAVEGSIATLLREDPGGTFNDSIAGLHASLMPLIPGYRRDAQAGKGDQSPAPAFLFTSSLPNEGKSTTVAAVARSLTHSGKRVLLIDADLRSPKLHRLFGVRAAAGLSNWDDRQVDLQSLILREPGGVYLLPAGPGHPRPLDILSSAGLRDSMMVWRASFDVILIDAPPVLCVADARVLVPLVTFCVFVARWRKTGWDTVCRGLRLLAEVGCPIAGVTLSRVDLNQFSDYGYPEPEFYSAPTPPLLTNGRAR